MEKELMNFINLVIRMWQAVVNPLSSLIYISTRIA